MGKHIIVKEVRCSFPRLYGTEVRDDQSFGPGIALILEAVKHKAVLELIKNEMRLAIANTPKLKANPPAPDKMCLKKPEDENLKYMPGNLIVKANNPRPPEVLHADGRTKMTEATDKIYSGCYVNAKIEIWGQANKWGRRVNAKLIAVQYVPKEAASFDGSYVSPEEAVTGFDSLDEGADALPGGESMGGGDVLGGGDDDLLG